MEDAIEIQSGISSDENGTPIQESSSDMGVHDLSDSDHMSDDSKVDF